MSSGRGPVRVVLADDELLLRTALSALLPLDGLIQVVGQASNGDEAVASTLEHEPDVLVIDLEMPGTDGLQAVARILAERPAQRVLMLTRHARPGVLRRALDLGVLGFMSKASDPEDIADAVERVHAGQRWIAHDVLEAAMADDSPLTAREVDVLRETREGYSVRDIARRLHLAPGTVRNYLSSAMQKTSAGTRHDAARVARERDWL
ncbi:MULTISPECIES: response regulator transcription factor [unclassified Pseudoclavibacter]|uniref:response regulator transcription factor n=1 Tax=unclassified Pseudoclavibacter TaxID=2615177 RepID=UPI0012F2AEBB|nr:MULTISPECIES: response regulator transcription factor [unclassified Pseudoclavibacter]VXC08489.1 DNA-binding response regulator [Pseudoclavibacter sp. 8L]